MGDASTSRPENLEFQLPGICSSRNNLYGLVKRPKEKAKEPKRKAKDLAISQLRKRIGWLQYELRRVGNNDRATHRQQRIRRLLKKRYGSDSPRVLKVSLEKEKACLRVKTLQSPKQREKEKFRKQNFNYQKYGPWVFQKHPNSTNTLTPSVVDVEDFWRGIVGVEGSYGLEDPAVKKWRTKTANIALDVDDFVLSND